MAADPRKGARRLLPRKGLLVVRGYLRRRRVGAARAEEGPAFRGDRLGVTRRDADARLQRVRDCQKVRVFQSFRHTSRDLVHLQRANVRQKVRPVPRLAPDLHRIVVQRLLDLRLQEGPLVFEDDDAPLRSSEVPERLGIQRPRHGDLVDAETPRIRAQQRQSIQKVAVGLARGDERERTGRVAQSHVVEATSADVLHCERQPHLPRHALRLDAIVSEQLAVQLVVVFCLLDTGVFWKKTKSVDVDAAGAVDDVGGADHAGPRAGVAGQFQSVQAVLQDVLQVRGVEERHLEVLQQKFRLIRKHRRLGLQVVSAQR
mmetsp:Transcript_18581/g.57117  ORF Transcript_18581/g.57117 Transcript_18581/m.57117 type:complete len:316 (+) Transcript_18581:470-1417(+)